MTARVICSSDNGQDFNLLPVSVSGDVNHSMTAGTGKQIIWNAAADFPGRYWAQVVAKVIASDGPATSGEMVVVPAGNFTMGANGGGVGYSEPAHTVYLDAYYIDKYEATNAEFKQFIDAGGYTTQAFWSATGWQWNQGATHVAPAYYDPSSPGFPVAGVTYWEAEAYANFVGKHLPTEAEWEKAARGTDSKTYPWGDNLDGSHANYNASNDPYSGWLTPVGYYDGTLHVNPPYQTASNSGPYGTFDQAGNVSEWVRDWFDYYSAGPASNPLGPPVGANKVLRGGSAQSGACNSNAGELLACWYRFPWNPSDYGNACAIVPAGFRCAKAAQ